MKEKIRKFVEKNKYLVKPFLVLMAIYLVGILAIILANVYFADDIGRTERGYAAWANFSRYISEISSRFFHADNYLTNIAPLLQVLSTAVLAVASLMLLVVIVGKDKFRESWTKWIWYAVAVVPLGLSPYMLECLSYQYDSIYMAMSVFFAVLPLTFRDYDWKWYVAFTVVGTLGVCMTYQAAAGIMPMLIVFLAVKDWNDKKAFIKAAAIGMGTFLVTLFVYQKFLMIPQDLYVSNSMIGFSELIPKTLEHLGEYFSYVFTDFKKIWLALLGVMMLVFVIAFVRNSKRNKVLATGMILAGTATMAVCIFILYSVLEKPLFATRAMYGVGAFIAVVGVYSVDKAKFAAAKWPVYLLVWCFFVFSFTYGNALRVQDEYRNTKLNMVMADLNGLTEVQEGGQKIIQVKGDVGRAPIIAHMPQSYQMLNRLLASSFGNGIMWDTYRLVYLADVVNLVTNDNVDLTTMNLPVIKSTAYYDICGADDKILIVFKETHRD